ncbi:hypothetical protein IR151_18270 [Clostridioides sp. ES-S-0006-03]|uniref:hypothetical protein n=1 Tax=Clostridioides sp. ES-S-0006-03 TaxID=2770775 RepID=UPI001D0C3F74|nr:hypothetical protein [Clostridioides sp. ES-S-0006-03]
MAFYVNERTIKKRRGCYSESDIHITPLYYEYRNCYASYNLSDIKNINIPERNKVVINSFEAYYLINNEKVIINDTIRQDTTIEFITDPIISISDDLGYISYACSINYEIIDIDPTTRFKIVYKLNDIVIGEKYNTTDSNYTIDLTEEQLSKLSFKSRNNITIELSTHDGGVFLTKVVSFIKGNTKPKLSVFSYNSTSAKFAVIDTDNNLTKIEWYLDDVLKETITTDLTTEKTINYELTDNAIHTLKIVATDAENETAEKVLSISKEIMPLQTDATLQDISSKLVEIGEGFKNGKTSIINTLALKNIEASLNNTLVELSEKIKTSFDSSDASVEELQNRITELTNELSRRKRFAKGTASLTISYVDNTVHQQIETNLSFRPSIILVKTNLFFTNSGFESHNCNLYSANNLTETYAVNANKNTGPGRASVYAQVVTISEKSFVLYFTTSLYFNVSQSSAITWYAFE